MIAGGIRQLRAKRRICTKPFFVLLSLSLLGLFYIGVRFTKGIGAVSNLSDGYPWGIWVAYDVAIGTAIACGGYTVAALTYIRNRGHYHHLIKSALLISLFGSCLAASAVIIDIGRPWNAYGFFIPTRWQPTSAFFELALGILAYCLAQSLEFFPTLIDALERGRGPLFLQRLALLIAGGRAASHTNGASGACEAKGDSGAKGKAGQRGRTGSLLPFPAPSSEPG